jgi:hypothetical protein
MSTPVANLHDALAYAEDYAKDLANEPEMSDLLRRSLAAQAMHWLERIRKELDLATAVVRGGSKPFPSDAIDYECSPAGAKHLCLLDNLRVHADRHPNEPQMANIGTEGTIRGHYVMTYVPFSAPEVKV